jgi:hypothetical protein
MMLLDSDGPTSQRYRLCFLVLLGAAVLNTDGLGLNEVEVLFVSPPPGATIHPTAVIKVRFRSSLDDAKFNVLFFVDEQLAAHRVFSRKILGKRSNGELAFNFHIGPFSLRVTQERITVRALVLYGGEEHEYPSTEANWFVAQYNVDFLELLLPLAPIQLPFRQQEHTGGAASSAPARWLSLTGGFCVLECSASTDLDSITCTGRSRNIFITECAGLPFSFVQGRSAPAEWISAVIEGFFHIDLTTQMRAHALEPSWWAATLQCTRQKMLHAARALVQDLPVVSVPMQSSIGNSATNVWCVIALAVDHDLLRYAARTCICSPSAWMGVHEWRLGHGDTLATACTILSL